MPTTATARRRWAKEIAGEVDGIAMTATGPVLMHGYEPPAGGKWVDEVIPGKLATLDRQSGEIAWSGPCEVGYGRGFGAGFGEGGDVIVMGPSGQGHRIVRMSRENGELKAVAEVRAFDDAHVFEDVCITVTAGRVAAISTETFEESWEYSRSGERFHHACRAGNRLFVAYTCAKAKRQGVLTLDVRTGRARKKLVDPVLPVIHDMTSSAEEIVLLTEHIAPAVPQATQIELLTALEARDESAVADTLSLLTLAASGSAGDAPLWFEVLATEPQGELPEVGIRADSGKLYLVQAAGLEVRDMLSGRVLGAWTVPGLDERIDWQVAAGACLVAEENRLSLFELPA